MARKAAEIKLTKGTRDYLEKLVGARYTPVAIAERAKIVLYAASGWNNKWIAQKLGIHEDTVAKWRCNWAGSMEDLAEVEEKTPKALCSEVNEVLRDARRCGRPMTYCLEQVAAVQHLACQDPLSYGKEATEWTGADLAEVANRNLPHHSSSIC